VISITDDETGQLLQFPDGTAEDVIRAAIARARAGTHHEHAVGPDFSDVEGGVDSTARQVPSSFDLSHLQRETDRAAAYPSTIDLSGAAARHPAVVSMPPNAGPQPPPLHRSEDYWRSVTGSDNPEDWSKYARNAQLGEVEAGGADAMSQAGFADRGMYYENPQTGERYLKHHKSGDMSAAAPPDPYADLDAQVDASREFLRGIPARVAGSVGSAVGLASRTAHGAVPALVAEAQNIGSGRPAGEGFRGEFLRDWAADPTGQGTDLIQRDVVDPARERLLDASIRAGDSPLAAAGTETGQAALGEVGNPVNWVGPAELVEGLRGAKALSPAAQRVAELEAQGGARVIEDGSGFVTREFGRGSAPSEIAQGKLARDLAVPRKPLIYRDANPINVAEPTWKGTIPDTLRSLTGRPWRQYPGEDGGSSIALDEPTTPSPRPRTLERDPLPMPPTVLGHGATDADLAQTEALWNAASTRYPSISSGVTRIKVGPEPAYFEPETGTLSLPPGSDLGTMMHEIVHVAQGARGQELGTAEAERYAVRAGDVYGRAAQPVPRGVSRPAPEISGGAVDGALVPLSKREYANAFNDESIVPTGGIRSDGEARAYTAWLEKNGMDPEHVERFGVSPELEQKFFDLHNPDIGPEPPVPQYELARIGAIGRPFPVTAEGIEGIPGALGAGDHASGPLTSDRAIAVLGPEQGAEFNALNRQLAGFPRRGGSPEDASIAAAKERALSRMEELTAPLSRRESDFLFEADGIGEGPTWHPPNYLDPDSVPVANYGRGAMDQVQMGPDGIVRETGPEAANSNVPPVSPGPRRLYASGPPPAPVLPPLTEPEIAKAMGWDVPPGSPRAISDPIRTANFQTNLAAQLGGGPESDRAAQYIVDNSDDVFRKIGPPQSWDTVEDMAARSGTTPEQFLHDNPRWNTLPPEERLRLTYVIKGNERAIGDLQSKLVAGTATPEEQAELLRRIDTASDLIKIGAKAGSDYGRALNTLKIEARLALGDDQLLKQRLYRMYADQLDKQKPLMDSLARLNPGDPEELQAFLRSVNKPKFREFVHEYWVNSILATPIPFERKVIGDTLMMLGENGFVRPLSAVWDAARTMGGGAAANAEREVFLRETPAAFTGLGRGIREGFRRGLQVIQRGYDPRLAEGTPLFIPRSAFARAQSPFVRNVVGPIVTMPTRVISAATTIARTMNFTAELYAQAARIASKEELAALRAGATGAFDVSGRIATLIKNPTDEMLQAADRFAGRATFTDQTSAIGQGITRLRDLPGVTSSNPVGNAALETYRAASGFMLPFVHIADRLMVRGFEYTPFNFANAAGQRMAGNYAESAAQAARASIGSMVMAYAASMAMEGRITGAAPKDEGERAAFYGANKQPWSIRTDDGRWVPYGHMQPIAMPLALTAAFYEGWKENPDDDLMGKITDGAVQVGTHITDQSYLLALSKLMDVLHGGEQGRAGRAGSDLAASTTWGLVPYSGLVRTIAKAVDPRVVDARSFSDRLTQNMPVASLGLNGKLDPWGEEVVPAGGRLRTVLASGTALLPTQEHTNPLDQELDRLGMPLGYVGNNVTDHKKKVKLTDDEHFLYQQMAGRASKLLLQELFAREGYGDLDTEQQRDEATKAIGAARKFARIVVLRYHNGAENYPGLNPSLGVVNWVNETGTGQGSGPGR
jgi:hypothetical protein